MFKKNVITIMWGQKKKKNINLEDVKNLGDLENVTNFLKFVL